MNTRTSRHLAAGISAATLAVVLAAFLMPTSSEGSSAKQGKLVYDPSCGCMVPPEMKGKRPKPGVGEWCQTQRRYELEQMASGNVSLAADCPLLGPADDPAARDAAIPTEATPVKTYRLVLHIFCEDDGTNPATTQENVDLRMGQVNASYAPWKIQFVYETKFRNSTRYRYLDDNEVSGMKRTFADAPDRKLNIYVTIYNPGVVSWGTFPWSSSALSTQGGIVMSRGMFGSPFLQHEIGHCLGLWHVFHGVTEVAQCSACYEMAGRSAADGDTKGDFCSDTNPTTNHGACSNPTTTDPCTGSPWLDTPYDNFMSYSWGCAVEFTPQQSGRMHGWTENRLMGWLVLPQPPIPPGSPTLTKLGGLNVQIAWADNSTDENNFEVQRERRSGSTWVEQQTVATVGANVTSTTNTVPNAGTYRYRVRATNGNGASNWSGWTQIKL